MFYRVGSIMHSILILIFSVNFMSLSRADEAQLLEIFSNKQTCDQLIREQDFGADLTEAFKKISNVDSVSKVLVLPIDYAVTNAWGASVRIAACFTPRIPSLFKQTQSTNGMCQAHENRIDLVVNVDNCPYLSMNKGDCIKQGGDPTGPLCRLCFLRRSKFSRCLI